MIALIDYGLGNLKSVSKALQVAGAEVKITNNPQEIEKAKAIVLPGVGTFQRGMRNLRKLNLLPVLNDAIEGNKPFLGICLGLQLLFSKSEEDGEHKGLGVIKGKVIKFSGDVKIPHIGWNQTTLHATRYTLHARMFEGIPNNSYFYFVHSYYVEPEDKSVIAATTNYGKEFVSAIAKGNVWGAQFHPEKSDKLGLKILENFLSLCQIS